MASRNPRRPARPWQLIPSNAAQPFSDTQGFMIRRDRDRSPTHNQTKINHENDTIDHPWRPDRHLPDRFRPRRSEAPETPQGPPPPELVKKFDKDGDGKLSEDERKAMREAMQAKMEERHKEMLEKYDADKDGKLSEEERKRPWRAARPRCSRNSTRTATASSAKRSAPPCQNVPRRGGPAVREENAVLDRPGSPRGPGLPPADAPVESHRSEKRNCIQRCAPVIPDAAFLEFPAAWHSRSWHRVCARIPGLPRRMPFKHPPR